MTDILFQGWTPNPQKVCARCGGTVDSILYQLCDDCHQEDADRVTDEIELEIAQHEADARLTIECARYQL